MSRIKIQVSPSAGMLWPRPRAVTLDGREFFIRELRVRDIGEIEYQVALIAGGPMQGMGDLADLMQNRVQEFRRLPREERDRLARIYIKTSSSWPPTMGSARFDEILGTPEGSIAFLRVVLAATHPEVDDAGVAELAFAMTEDEWCAVERIAWGKAPWEDASGGGGGGDGRGGGRGTNWAAIARAMASQRRWSYDQIGDLTVGQVLNELNDGKPRSMYVATGDAGRS